MCLDEFNVACNNMTRFLIIGDRFGRIKMKSNRSKMVEMRNYEFVEVIMGKR